MVVMAIVLALLAGLTIVVARYAYWDSNDWPRLLSEIRNHCDLKTECILNVADAYNFEWYEMVAFADGGERAYKENVVGRKLNNYQEHCQGLAFLNAQGDIIKEEYSGCYEEFFALNRQPLVRFAFDTHNYFRVSRTNPTVCVTILASSGTRGNYLGFDDTLRHKYFDIRAACRD
jgi:hypothetical protein